MTEIFHNNGLSIQVFNIARTVLAAGATRNDDVTLDRAGRFLCAMAVPDTTDTTSDIHSTVKTVAGDELTYGLQVSQIRVRTLNSSAVGPAVGIKLVAYIGVSAS